MENLMVLSKSVLVPEVLLPVKMYLKPERIQELLAEVPRWELHPEGHALVRTRELSTEGGVRAFVDMVTRLALVQKQPVEMRCEGNKVVVALTGHRVRGCIGGLSEGVFTLAKLIG